MGWLFCWAFTTFCRGKGEKRKETHDAYNRGFGREKEWWLVE